MDWDRLAAGAPERLISLNDCLVQEDDALGVAFPSKLLEIFRPNTPTRSFLLRYRDDVIQHDYKGMIKWGIVNLETFTTMEVVVDVLSAWHSRCTEEPSVREAFEKELISQVEEDGGCCLTTVQYVREKLPDLKHDMIFFEFVLILEELVEKCYPDYKNHQFYDEKFKNFLMTTYDFEDKDNPSFAFVVIRSFLKCIQMSKHGEGRLGKRQLGTLRSWLFWMNHHSPEQLGKDKGDLLLEILQNAKLEPSQLLETAEPKRIESYFVGDSYYEYSHPWRYILEILSDGAKEKNENQQYPLSILLANGLPGQDILLAANEKIADTICPVENTYPFLLAARKRDYGTAVAAAIAENEDFATSLDREHLSQTYMLLRAQQEPLVNLHKDRNLEFDEAYTKEATECFAHGQRLDVEKAKLKKGKLEFEELVKKREFEEMETNIAQEEAKLTGKRKSLKQKKPMCKKKKTT